jgi:YjbE family integral membrane protein
MIATGAYFLASAFQPTSPVTPAASGFARVSLSGTELMELLTAGGLAAFLQVIAIDLVLSGDNAIVIGLATAGLPAHLRTRAIVFGIGIATVLRIIFAAVTTYLLGVVGLQLVGGLLLSWVCWKMWSELRQSPDEDHLDAGATAARGKRNEKTFAQAAIQIVVADVSMSLDNVLAVAGAAQDHTAVLVIGLITSILLMGIAANLVAKLLHRFRWISYVGLAVIVYVAVTMIYHGVVEVWPLVA